MLCAAEIRIIPDWTILIELAIFIIAIIVLNAFVLGPMLRVMDRRREFTVDASQEAEKLSEDADQFEQGRHEVLAMTLREAQAERDEKTQKALREADRIKAEAMSRMDETMSSSEISVKSAKGSIIEEMNQRSKELADEIVARING